MTKSEDLGMAESTEFSKSFVDRIAEAYPW